MTVIVAVPPLSPIDCETDENWTLGNESLSVIVPAPTVVARVALVAAVRVALKDLVPS